MSARSSAFFGGIVGSVVGAVIGATGAIMLAKHDGYRGIKRERLIGDAFVSGAGLGATLGAVIAVGNA